MAVRQSAPTHKERKIQGGEVYTTAIYEYRGYRMEGTQIGRHNWNGSSRMWTAIVEGNSLHAGTKKVLRRRIDEVLAIREITATSDSTRRPRADPAREGGQ